MRRKIILALLIKRIFITFEGLMMIFYFFFHSTVHIDKIRIQQSRVYVDYLNSNFWVLFLRLLFGALVLSCFHSFCIYIYVSRLFRDTRNWVFRVNMLEIGLIPVEILQKEVWEMWIKSNRWENDLKVTKTSAERTVGTVSTKKKVKFCCLAAISYFYIFISFSFVFFFHFLSFSFYYYCYYYYFLCWILFYCLLFGWMHQRETKRWQQQQQQ